VIIYKIGTLDHNSREGWESRDIATDTFEKHGKKREMKNISIYTGDEDERIECTIEGA
jgi:hypothetical protein